MWKAWLATQSVQTIELLTAQRRDAMDKRLQEAAYELQLMVLGACLGNRKMLDSVKADDFADTEIAIVVEYMKAKATGADVGSDRIHEWTARRGVTLNGKQAIETIIEKVKAHARYKRAEKIVRGLALGGQTLDPVEFVERLKQEAQKL